MTERLEMSPEKMIEALNNEVRLRDREIERLRADRDAGAKDYCALMERHDRLHVENERMREALVNLTGAYDYAKGTTYWTYFEQGIFNARAALKENSDE